MTAIKDLLDVLRVEVELPTSGLKNLLANPSGDLGAWAWLTTIGQIKTGSDAGGAYLEYVAPGGAFANGPASETVPVTPGQYIAATWYVVMNEEPYAAGLFEFQDASGAAISTLPAAPVFTNTVGGRQSVAPQLIPAGAVTARFLFRVSTTAAGTGGTTAGKRLRWRETTVATATTAAALGPTYTNLATNPSFEGATVGWVLHSGEGAAPTKRTDGAGTTGSRASSLKVICTGAKAEYWSPERPVVAGTTYSCGIWRTDPTEGSAYVKWFNAAHTEIAATAILICGPLDGQRGRVDATAPPTAAYARIAYARGFGDNYLDDWHIIDGAGVPYFDGATADTTGIDYGWTGAADASTSTKIMSNLPYIPPIVYQEVQGSAVSLSIQRRTFDATLGVTIRDATLDPALSDLIRPGRQVRVRVLDSGAAWQVLFQGRAAKPAVDYGDLKRKTRPTITLSAYGPGAELAGVSKRYGVATIAALPQVLEGVRIPFKVNGSTDQVPDSAVVSDNDQATALDQVILTRDSTQGYAWVTKDGVLMANSNRTLDYYGTGVATFDEGEYTALGLDYDPEKIINMVTVILLTYNSTTGETVETTYGPYVDQASFRVWGPCPAEFRVQGAVDPATYAASVLAANAQGQQRVNSLRVPITDTADLTPTKGLIDLYALANVINTDRAIDLDQRVQGVDHTITWSRKARPRWYMDLVFTGDDQVATPISTPPAGPEGGVKDGVWQVVGSGGGAPAFTNAWVDHGSFAPTAFLKEDGYVRLRGVVKNGVVNSAIFTLPPGYRPSAGTRMFCAMNNGVAGRLEVTTAGVVRLFTGGSNAYVSLDGISFKAEG